MVLAKIARAGQTEGDAKQVLKIFVEAI